ncbi:MAG: AmmeMemoRadiSam system protein B, partial [bacterium]|nr:AmmeMemoRadiSam system protein B [bacterium]
MTGVRVAVSLVCFGCLAGAQVQKATGTGQWYPAEAEALERALAESFEAADKRAGGIPGRKGIHALVAPHAAIQYSGIVAGSAYRLLDEPDNVILLAFSHRERVDGVVGIDVGAYETPLGEVAVNREVLRGLGFPLKGEDTYADHSLENQLPFLQCVAPKAKIVPLYVGNLEGPELTEAARKLAARIRAGDVIIASSDFTHYGK